MELSDLPLELLQEIFKQCVYTLGLYQIVRLRVVSKFFNQEIGNAISSTEALNYRNYPRVAGIFHRHGECVRKLGDLNQMRLCVPHGICRRFLTRYLYDRVVAGNGGGDLLVAIRGTVEVLLEESVRDEAGTTKEARRLDYTMELCKAATATLDPCFLLDYAMTPCCRQTATLTAENSHHLLVAAIYLDLRPLVLRLLAENGDGVSISSVYFGTPLEAAASKGNLDLLRRFLDYGMDVNKDSVYGTVLHRSALSGNQDVVQLLLEPQYNCEVTGDSYDEAICNAARGGHLNIGDYLLQHVTTVRPYNLETILLCEAARNGQEEMVRELLHRDIQITPEISPPIEYGTPIRTSEKKARVRLNHSALDLASSNGHAEVVRIILTYLKSKNYKSLNLERPMARAIKSAFKTVVQIFLDFGADINCKHISANTHSVLDAITRYGKVWRDEMLIFLLEKGLDLLADVEIAERALKHAARFQYLDIIRILMRNGVDMNSAKSGQMSAVVFVREEYREKGASYGFGVEQDGGQREWWRGAGWRICDRERPKVPRRGFFDGQCERCA